MAAKDIAYGISALSTKLHSHAENDELLVRESDGKMFYKRDPHGQIVGFSDDDYTDKELVRNIVQAFNAQSISINIADIAMYHTYDISDTVFLNETTAIHLTLPKTFVTTENEHGFFIRIRGSQEVNSVVAYTDKASAIPGANEVKLGFEVNEAVHEITIHFNELTFVDLHNVAPVSVDIKYLIFPNFKGQDSLFIVTM